MAKLVKKSSHFKAERDNVIEGVREHCDKDTPLIVISRDYTGKIYVASTTSGDETEAMMEEAAEWIENNTVEMD